MEKIRLLVESVLMEEDHLSLDDKPEDSQSLELTVDGEKLEGWVCEEGGQYKIVMFRNSDDVDMYIEHTVESEEELKGAVAEVCKKLLKSKHENSDDQLKEDDSDEEDDDDSEESEDDDDEEELAESKKKNPFAKKTGGDTAADDDDDDEESDCDSDED